MGVGWEREGGVATKGTKGKKAERKAGGAKSELAGEVGWKARGEAGEGMFGD
jgi:hypothetical protein